MGLKKFKPVTPGQRFKEIVTREDLSSKKPEKGLVERITKTGGRNSQGKRTMRYIGGGAKKIYRIIDFKRDKDGIKGIVRSIEYDPNRSARIALVVYSDGEKRYIIAPKDIKIGQEIMSGSSASPDNGNALFLRDIPLGSFVHNIELRPGEGGKIARSAGSYAQLLSRDGKYAVLKLKSGETRMVLVSCKATIGIVSNVEHNLEKSGKAGRKRWLGRRPRTRAVAMNPIDHPMGGGEGRASGGHPRSRKGLPAKGYRTRSKKKSSNKYIIERRKK